MCDEIPWSTWCAPWMIQAGLCARQLTEHIVSYAAWLRIWKQSALFTRTPWRGTCVHDLNGTGFSYWVGAALEDRWVSMKEVINSTGLNCLQGCSMPNSSHFSPTNPAKNSRRCVDTEKTARKSVDPDHHPYKPPTTSTITVLRTAQLSVLQACPAAQGHCCTCLDTEMMTESQALVQEPSWQLSIAATKCIRQQISELPNTLSIGKLDF